jgi:hypothetical protein
MLLNYGYMKACPHNEFYIRTVGHTEILVSGRDPVLLPRVSSQVIVQLRVLEYAKRYVTSRVCDLCTK